jgi:uncharacterized membrane protein
MNGIVTFLIALVVISILVFRHVNNEKKNRVEEVAELTARLYS